jgi:dihydroorotate dehydrogenase
MYSHLRRILFSLPPEVAHKLTLELMRFVPAKCFTKSSSKPVEVMGIEFPHRLGLAAGLDVSGKYLDCLSKIGFAFIELGGVTPRPQQGNPKPRVFRLQKAEAIINRMGFDNPGVDALVMNLKKANYQGIVGVNIGKNKDTSLNNAIDDYLYCLRRVYKYSSYVTINISSPNTPGLRQLQQGEYFANLMQMLRSEQLILADKYKRYVPLVIKISPDETDEVLINMAQVILKNQIDGIIATNTTRSRTGVEDSQYADEVGGLSGPPLFQRSVNTLRVLRKEVGDRVALIGLGGINSSKTAKEKIDAGASLLQAYTGLIYHGPKIARVAEGL